MKSDEAAFLIALARHLAGAPPGQQCYTRDLINGHPIHHKRAMYLLRKWTLLGWYDYGVGLDMGWLTEEGKGVAKELERRQ